MAVHNNLRVFLPRLQAMNELLRRVTSSNAIQGQLWKHTLVAIPPAQQRHCVGEDLICTHHEQPFADACVLLLDRRRGLFPRDRVLPRCLHAVLAADEVLRGAWQAQETDGLQLQQLAELQDRRAGGGQVRGVEEDRIAWLELGAEALQHGVGAHYGRGQADLLRRQLLEDLGRHTQDVLLVADQQRASGADRALRVELGRLRQYEHGVVLLQLLDARAHLLDAPNAAHAQADSRLLQLRIHHGVVHRHGEHAHQQLVVIQGPLQSLRLGLDLHGAAEGLPVLISPGRAQDVLHGSSVVDLR
mmetsp:Transcript_66752/g.173650  ORF Transcript_66752/g.173650 Transcript_66752/m.173650 type:complete len:302 (+) Transcript_66752:323-1228(+)